jgi:hypothetical protein
VRIYRITFHSEVKKFAILKSLGVIGVVDTDEKQKTFDKLADCLGKKKTSKLAKLRHRNQKL